MPMPQNTGPIPRWTRRDNFSNDRRNELVGRINQVQTMTPDENTEIRQGPDGQMISAPRTPGHPSPQLARGFMVVARVISKTIPKWADVIGGDSPGDATLATGFYAGRLQYDKGTAIDPTQPINLVNYYGDVNTAFEDCYINNFAENNGLGSPLATDGTIYIIGQHTRQSLGGPGLQPALPVIRVAGVGGGSLSAGQYQYQSYMMVAQNVPGWDWIRGHPLI